MEAHIKIEDELAVRGWRRALRFKALRDISYFFAVRLIVVWVVISIVNSLADVSYLTSYHLVALATVWIIASAHRYSEWYGEIGKTKGWEFDAVLEETGVSTFQNVPNESNQFHEWSSYRSYREFDDYLEIEHEDGNFSFIPLFPELNELIEFTKSKIHKRPGY